MKIGIIREGKVPPDFRVALTPKQCRLIKETYTDVQISVGFFYQSTLFRCK